VLLATGLFEQKYYLSPDGDAVLSFPRVAADGADVANDAAAVVSFLDGTRVTLASGLPRLWSMPDDPSFSPSGTLVAFFAAGGSGKGRARKGPAPGRLEVAAVPGGEIVGQLDEVRTFVWLAGDRLYAVAEGREESLVPVPLSLH
jgi:hypothetical protein